MQTHLGVMMEEVLKDLAFDVLGLGLGAGLSFSCYACFRTGQNVVRNIKDTPELLINEELVSIVKDSGDLQACIWGKVQSEESPFHSFEHRNVLGVIWKQTIKEHMIARVMGVWVNVKNVISETIRFIPFSLTKDGVRVKIINPSEFESVDLSVVSEKFISADDSLGKNLMGFVKGVRPTGTQYTEEMLVEGTQVLCFGNLVLEKNCLYLKPHSAIPFIVSTKDKPGVISDFEAPLAAFKLMSFLTAFFALYFSYVVSWKLHKHWKEYKKRRMESKILDEVKQKKEANVLPENLMCIICSELRDILLMPCKHVCICGECYKKLNPKICPVCRTKVKSIQPLYYS